VPEAAQGVQAWDRYAYVNNSPVNYNDPSGHCIDPAVCPRNNSINISGLWDPLYIGSVGNVGAAEQAFTHYIEDPQYFVDLYANPDAWRASEEVANLDIFMQYSVFHTTANDLLIAGLDPDTAGNLELAHFFSGMGDPEESAIYLAAAAGGVSVEELIKQAKEQYPNKANKMEWHHYEPRYLGGSANGTQYHINAAYHQYITNEFRRQFGYGQAKSADMQAIMDEVYTKYPIPPNSNKR
jgi:hypothetical protein